MSFCMLYMKLFFLNLLGKSGKAHSRKSSQSSSAGLPSKKSKNSAKDVLAEAGKHSNYVEVALFDKVQCPYVFATYSTIHNVHVVLSKGVWRLIFFPF